MIRLILEGKELKNISEKAKEWLYVSIKKGKKGPFTIAPGKEKVIILTRKLTDQRELF